MNQKKNTKPQILLTNDDGIRSPGLWAAAQALGKLGFVTVVAPRDQYSGAGRSLPSTSDGIITPQQVLVNGQEWTVYSVGGSPAQAVLHGALEVLPKKPELVVSGINFGENLGTGITVSGTVGAALEAAALGIPALAISLETEIKDHFSLSTAVDFSTAGFFTEYFSNILLKNHLPPDVDILKVDIPANANVNSPWKITRISRTRLFESLAPKRKTWEEPALMGYRFAPDFDQALPGTDVHAVKIGKMVSVTPISLDMTSRVDLQELENLFRHEA